MKRLIADIRWLDTNKFETHYVAIVNNEADFDKAMDDDSIFFVFYPDELEPHTEVDFEFLEFREDDMIHREDLPTFTNNDPFEALNFLEALLENVDIPTQGSELQDDINTAIAWIREALEESDTGYEDRDLYENQQDLFGDQE